MEAVISGIILIFVLIIAYKLSKGQSKKRKHIVWGITTILGISPLLSFLVGWIPVIITDEPWLGVGIFFLAFLVILLVGMIILIMGFFVSDER